MFRFSFEIPGVEIRTELMSHAYERRCFNYIRWYFRFWKWHCALDWGMNGEEMEERKMKKQFAYQEAVLGFFATLPTVAFLGWWGVPLAIACGILWMFGGTYHKAIRRWGVPLTIWLHTEILRGWPSIDIWPVVAFAVGVAILYQGDGFPDHRPTTADPGSRLGRFVERFFPDDRIGGPLTKAIAATAFALSTTIYLVK